MSPTITQALDEWMSLYANSAALRTGIGFAHVAGLIAGGGMAVVADRATLAVDAGSAPDRMLHLKRLKSTHRTVVLGLTLVVLSGALLLAADLEMYLSSWAFWTKMGLMVALLVNGGVMLRVSRLAERGSVMAWRGLRLASLVSLALWFLTTLMGAALPNV